MTIKVSDATVETSNTGIAPILEKTATTLTWIAVTGGGKFELDIISGFLKRSIYGEATPGDIELVIQETYQCRKVEKTLLD